MIAALILFTLSGFLGFFLWKFHIRIEALIGYHDALDKRVKDGEKAIIENFGILQKKLHRIENEIKSSKRQEPQAKEAIKAIRRLERSRVNE